MEQVPDAKQVSAEAAPKTEEVDESASIVQQNVVLIISAPSGKKIEYQVPSVVTLSEVRLYLMESPDMWYVTRYQFNLDGKKVSDYVEVISLIPEEKRTTTDDKPLKLELTISTIPYDLQSALFHLRNLRKSLFPQSNSASLSLFYSIAGARSNKGQKAGGEGGASGGKKKKKGKKAPAVTQAPAAAPAANEANPPAAAAAVAGDAGKEEEGSVNQFSVHVPSDFATDAVSLSTFFPEPVDATVLALRSLTWSVWNPCPPRRRVCGDLFYLDAELLDGVRLCITASEKGFFVNGTKGKKFDSAATSKVFVTLPDLLSSLSDSFRGSFKRINSRMVSVDTLETMPFPGGPTPWLGKPTSEESRTPNAGAAEDALLQVSGFTAAPGLERDWNEEYQILYARSINAHENRLAILNNFFRVHSEFVDACQKGAVAVVDGEVSPLNPYDPPESQMWLHNNIFFSIAANVGGMFDGLGGDVAAHKYASHELTSIRLLRSAGVPGLHACAQTIVDYRGRRVICQSVVPGLLSQAGLEAAAIAAAEEEERQLIAQQEQQQQAQQGAGDKGAAPAVAAAVEEKPKEDAAKDRPGGGHAFGPSDDLSTYNKEAEFEKLSFELGRRLSIKPTVATFSVAGSAADAEKDKIKCGGPLELRGLFGGDKRKYFFELLRLLPRDANFREKEKSYCLVRPELMEFFRDFITNQAFQDMKDRKLAREEAKKKAAEEAKEKGEGKAPEEAKKEGGEEEEDVLYLPKIEVNTNLLVHDDRLVFESEEEKKHDLDLLDSIGQFIVQIAIPHFVNLVAQQPISDLMGLVPLMHERGINARYLGRIAVTTVSSNPAMSLLCIEEMIVRAAKNLLRQRLAKVTLGESAETTATFLNEFLGSRSQRGGGKVNFFGNQQLWDQIKSFIHERFDFTLIFDPKLASVLRKVTLLRSVCLTVGITITARDYNFESTSPFSSDDILAFHPVTRHNPPEVPDIAEIIVRARSFLGQVQTLPRGIEMLEQAMQAIYHIMGPHTSYAAHAHQLLATAYFAIGDPSLAVQHSERHALILERLRGLDDEATVRAYGTLALYYHEAGMSAKALPFIRRALYLERLVSGLSDPAIPVTLANLGMILQGMGDIEGSIGALLRTLELYEASFNQLMAVGTCRRLAVLYQSVGQYKNAIQYEKRYNKVVAQVYPADHEKVVESNQLLSQLTTQAVQVAKDRLLAAKANRPAPDSAAAASSQTDSKRSKARGPLSVLPKPGGAGSQPMTQVLSWINAKNQTRKTKK